MPKKLNLEIIQSQLPPFVQIVPESYRGVRYSADFIDTEYNEKFCANVRAVIALQHGCKTRANKKRSDRTKGKPKGMIPLEEIKTRLPPYLQIIDSTYKGIRAQATFYDTEYAKEFTGLVCNVLRYGLGYCPERKIAEFQKLITIPAAEIQIRLNNLYQNEYTIIPESYSGTNNVASFKLSNGDIRRFHVFHLLSGRTPENVLAYERWRRRILIRDNNTCQICGSTDHIEPHHLFSWTGFPLLRFDLNNGIAICQKEHVEFHAKHGLGDNTLNQFLTFINEKRQTLSSLAEVLRARIKLSLANPGPLPQANQACRD